MCPSCEIACCSGVYERTSRRALLASLITVSSNNPSAKRRGKSVDVKKKNKHYHYYFTVASTSPKQDSQHANPLSLFMPLKSKHALQLRYSCSLPFGLLNPWTQDTCGAKLTCTKSTSPRWLGLMCTYHFCIDFA